MNRRVLVVRAAAAGSGAPCSLLREHGYTVVEAVDSAGACAALDRQPPDLALLDVDVGGSEDGWVEWLDSCRGRSIGLLLFSGGGRHRARLAAWAARADGVLMKPGDSEELLARVAGLTCRRQLQEELNRARRELREGRRVQEEELRSAAQIQRSLIPARLPDLPEVQFGWCFRPFEKVGGDLFNVLQLDENTIMAFLLDVSGHGLSSAMVTVSVYQSLSPQTGRLVKRAISEPPFYALPSPAAVLASLEREYPFERFDKFFTIVYLLLDLPSGRVRYGCAGHPPPLLVHADGEPEHLPQGGGIVGLGIDDAFPETEVQMHRGERLYLFSDGITEYCDPGGRPFGSERLFHLLAGMAREPLQEGCDRVLEDLRRFGQGRPLQDDATLLALEYRGG